MPHIAEGLLHAHLDGALGPDEQLEWTAAERHLEVCPDCRERLEEARDLRARARDLLGGTAASVPPGPGFEALAAEADARRDAGDEGMGASMPARPDARVGGTAPWWQSTARLAWAASLVLAAGAGWFGHELLMEQGGGPPPPAAVNEPSALDGRGDAAAGEDQQADTDAAVRRERTQDAPAEGQEPPQRALEDAPVPTTETDTAPEAAAEPQEGRAGDAEEAARQAQAVPEAAEVAPETPADRMEEFRIQGQALKASDEGSRCFEAVEVEAETDLSRAADALRLDPDGTVHLRTQAGILVGFWESLPADSTSVRVTDGSDWIELRLSEAEDGLSGTGTAGGTARFRTADCPAASAVER